MCADNSAAKDSGFWGGIVVGGMRNGGGNVILAGHSRVAAALLEGVTHADLFVMPDPTPETMLRIYGIENATQRGTYSTSISGTVAGAIRLVAKGLLSGDHSINLEWSKKSLELASAHLTSAKGIGEPIVTKFLSGVPGMNELVIRQQLANLKASGDYARRLIH